MAYKRWILNNKPKQVRITLNIPLFRKITLRNILTTFDLLKFKYIFYYFIIEFVNFIAN
jgi:hypothetical protein